MIPSVIGNVGVSVSGSEKKLSEVKLWKSVGRLSKNEFALECEKELMKEKTISELNKILCNYRRGVSD